jgi:hypothetical protein
MKLASLALCIALAGCAMGWSKPGATEAEFYRDRFDCDQQAASMYPTAMGSIGGGYQAPTRTSCTGYGNQMNCTTIPGAQVAAPQQDMNATARMGAFHSCMESKGYRFGRRPS